MASALLAASPLAMDSDAQLSDNKPSITQSQNKSSEYTNEEMHNILTRTLWAEARNDGYIGMNAVASVIYNRGKGDPEKMVRAVKAKKQFSCWNRMSQSDWVNFKMKHHSGTEWEHASRIAYALMVGKFRPSHNYDHYYNPKKANPSWAYTDKSKTRLHPHEKIGSHYFMRLKRFPTR